MKADIQIAAYQMNSIWKSPEQNLDQLREVVNNLPSDTDLLVLPEMWPTGFVMDPEMSAVDMNHPIFQEINQLAAKHNLGIAGSIPVKHNGNYYNRAFLHSGGGHDKSYDKQYLFSPSCENKRYKAGESGPTFSFLGWDIKLQVCYDLRFPEGVRDSQQPDLIIYMANWPAARISHWNTLLQARAIENQCYVLGCNRTGSDGNGWSFPGNSVIVDYSGKVLEKLDTKPAVLIKSISKSQAENYRSKYPFYKDKKVKI